MLQKLEINGCFDQKILLTKYIQIYQRLYNCICIPELKPNLPITINGLSITIPSATTAKLKAAAAAASVTVEPVKKKEDSDSSDIQILDEFEESDEDDPDNSGMHTNDKLNSRTSEGKVIVNISEKKPDELIYVAESIQSVIKPHQIGGVRFLYDNIIGKENI